MQDTAEVQEQVETQGQVVRRLQLAIYSQPDPASDDVLLDQLHQEQQRLVDLRSQLRDLDASNVNDANDATDLASGQGRGRVLGRDTTGICVETTIRLDPLPTGIYHFMNHEAEPLVTVNVENVSHNHRRICVKAYIEGLSAQAVRTIELEPRSEPTPIDLQPTFLPGCAEQIKEVQRATLHVIVEDLDGKIECHDTHVLTCLARTASFNAARGPDGKRVDLSHYYGAWVTPYDEAVQMQIRQAITSTSPQSLMGYQKTPQHVPSQVSALYQSLREADIKYVNSIIDFGAPEELVTQRTRLPRESLEQRSANCIDGTVLMASLIEGIALNPAIVLVPGHAFVGWETWKGSNEWQCMETTQIGTAPFEAACASGQHQYERALAADQVTVHSLRDLRKRGIWPME